MIVMKFGGTSVKDRDAILRVTEIVRGRMGGQAARGRVSIVAGYQSALQYSGSR